MSDVFREVEEEVRRERLKKLWDRYQYVVYGVAFLIIVGVGGWRGHQWWEARRAAEMGTAFEHAATLSEENKHAEAAAAYAKIAAEGAGAYHDLARLRAASELSAGDVKAAIAAYKEIADDTAVAPLLRELAKLRAAAMQIDERAFDDARKLLEPMAEPGRHFRHAARELLAIAAWRSGDAETLKRWTDTITKDPETPLSTRSRVDMLVALGAAQGKS